MSQDFTHSSFFPPLSTIWSYFLSCWDLFQSVSYSISLDHFIVCLFFFLPIPRSCFIKMVTQLGSCNYLNKHPLALYNLHSERQALLLSLSQLTCYALENDKVSKEHLQGSRAEGSHWRRRRPVGLQGCRAAVSRVTAPSG